MSATSLRDHLLERVIEAAVIVILTILAIRLMRDHGSQREFWIEVGVTIIVAIILTIVLSSRHVLLLWNLQPSSSIVRLFRLRRVAIEGQRHLANEYRHLQARFVALLDKKLLTDATYREQMAFARILYTTHRERFWATTLDPWSDFVRSNEAYAKAMEEKGESLPDLLNDLRKTDSLPQRARVFILPADRFVADLLRDPSAARELVKCHFRIWKTMPRLLLLDPTPSATLWSEIMALVAEGEVRPSIAIPDFMLVDKRFVYGRLLPEVLEDEVLMSRSSFTLGFCEDKAEAAAYESLFRNVWQEATPILDFARAVLSTDEARSSRPADRSIDVAIRSLTSRTDAETEKIRVLLANTHEDIYDFIGEGERHDRYAKLLAGANEGRTLGELFLTEMRSASDPCYAIDQADLKHESQRFPSTWMEKHYHTWREAFASSSDDSLRRRIYVVRDWQFGDDPWLETLLMEEVGQKGIQVGLITKHDLSVFAKATRGVDAAVHDAEWIIINADGHRGRPAVGPTTMGVSIGTREIKRERARSAEVKLDEKDLILQDKMNAYLDWQETIWTGAGDKLRRLKSVEEVRLFVRNVVGMSPAA